MQEAKKVDHMTVSVQEGLTLEQGTFTFYLRVEDKVEEVSQTIFSEVANIFRGLSTRTTFPVLKHDDLENPLAPKLFFKPGFHIVCELTPGQNSALSLVQRVGTIPVLDENGKLVKSADELMQDLNAVRFIQRGGEGFKPGKGTGIAVAAVLFAVLAYGTRSHWKPYLFA